MSSLTFLPILKQHTMGGPAGWYSDPWFPDPVGSAAWLRYWDGFEWTSRTALTLIGDDAEAAPATLATEEAPPETPPTYEWRPSGPVGLPRRGITPARATWKYSAGVVAFTLVLIAAIAFAGTDHKTTAVPLRKAAAPLPHRTPAALSVRITSPTDGATVHGRSAIVRGFVSRDGARVTVNGRSPVVSGHRFVIRVPLRLGDNGLDIAAEMAGARAGTTTVSIVRMRTASERRALLAREEARRLAAEQPAVPAAAAPAGPTRVAPRTTYYGSNPATGTQPSPGASDDADLEPVAPKPAAPVATPPTPAPPPGGRVPPPPAAPGPPPPPPAPPPVEQAPPAAG